MSPETAETGASRAQSIASTSPLYLVGIALAAITGFVHLWMGVSHGSPPLLAAGVGFGVGIAAVLTGYRRRLFVLLGVPFTAGQIVLYFVGHDHVTTIGLVDKVVQGALILVLVALAWRR